MNDNIANVLYGVLGGGLVATGMRLVETYMIAPRLSESIDARKKLFTYARPLSYACHELAYRINAIVEKIDTNTMNGTQTALSLSPTQAKSIDWFTKEGYYISSTAYLMASVSCWIQLYERDVVFLQFGRSSLTKEFFDIIEAFKNRLSSGDSILWYHYVNGIGELLIGEEGDRPITLSEFIYTIHQDELFRGYYDQLFIFLNQVADKRHLQTLKDTLRSLEDIQAFLVSNKISIAMR